MQEFVIPKVVAGRYGDMSARNAGDFLDSPSILVSNDPHCNVCLTRIKALDTSVPLSGMLMADVMTIVLLGSNVTSIINLRLAAQPPWIPFETVKACMIGVSMVIHLFLN
jgi:hypothetical protein